MQLTNSWNEYSIKLRMNKNLYFLAFTQNHFSLDCRYCVDSEKMMEIDTHNNRRKLCGCGEWRDRKNWSLNRMMRNNISVFFWLPFMAHFSSLLEFISCLRELLVNYDFYSPVDSISTWMRCYKKNGNELHHETLSQSRKFSMSWYKKNKLKGLK